MTIFIRVLFCALMVILNLVSLGCGSSDTADNDTADNDTTVNATTDNDETPHFFRMAGYNNGDTCLDRSNGVREAVRHGRCNRIPNSQEDWTPYMDLGLNYNSNAWYGAVGCNEGYNLPDAQSHCEAGSLCTVQYDLNLVSHIHGYELDGRVYGIWQIDANTEEGSCRLYAPCLPYCGTEALFEAPCPTLEDNAIQHRLCTSCRFHTGKWIRGTEKQHTCSP